MPYTFSSGSEMEHRLSGHVTCGPTGPGLTSVYSVSTSKLAMFSLSVPEKELKIKNLSFLVNIRHSSKEVMAVFVEAVDDEDLSAEVTEGDLLSVRCTEEGSCADWVWQMTVTSISGWEGDFFSPGIETRFFRFMTV